MCVCVCVRGCVCVGVRGCVCLHLCVTTFHSTCPHVYWSLNITGINTSTFMLCLGGTGGRADMVSVTVVYWTGISAGGGGTGLSVGWESSAYTGFCFLVTVDCGTIHVSLWQWPYQSMLTTTSVWVVSSLEEGDANKVVLSFVEGAVVSGVVAGDSWAAGVCCSQNTQSYTMKRKKN